MCVWVQLAHNDVVIHDERGEWMATARDNTVASSIVERHNKNEVTECSKVNTNNIDPSKIRWSSKVDWK